LTKIANICQSFAGGITMATMNVSLPDLMRKWVESQIETGHYSNVSDYIRDLIRRDQEYKDKREALLKALTEGERSGVSKRTLDDIWKDVKTRE
jgi:antitoxin ParD1/3/4